MTRTLSYADAVRLLGGDTEFLDRLKLIGGGVILGAAATFPQFLALLGAEQEIIRIGHGLGRRLRERREGLTRVDRTRRIAAAHTVLVVTAYFEAMAAADLPIRYPDLELTRDEQVAVTGPSAQLGASFVQRLLDAGETLPDLTGGHEDHARILTAYYEDLSRRVERLLSALAVWERLDRTARERYRAGLGQVPADAVRRYAEHLRALAGDFPDVGVWLELLEHQATRDTVRRLEPSLVRLERELDRVSSGQVTPGQALSLGRAYRATLDRPIADSGDVPANLVVPTLAEAYIVPRYRITDVEPRGGPSDEQWWETVEVRDDLERFLWQYVTSTQATEAPILVLGQPGAGKSALTRVLAARLPVGDFLAVRVPLRDVAAESEVQGQIEQAIRQATGEPISWPALVRSHPTALPVVLIDGFDELLQATGLRQTDYLTRVADFQRREADQGRPLAIIVTTRTSVADRARTPPGALLLRLEPFDASRIAIWTEVWNRTNAANFARIGVEPLDLDTVLAQGELAGQPLLLLMLALYDADGNALRRLSSHLQLTDLYEQLLTNFAQREIVKLRPQGTSEELAVAVEEDMRRLSIVAFAMFNRQSQWVTEAGLEQDLTAIFGGPTAAEGAGLRSSIGMAESALGRFFFVHRAQAQRDAQALHTYEFLHATFGEYLVARLTWQVARDTSLRARASTLPSGGIDDELLYALLSFAGLTARRPIVEFLTAMASDLDPAEREQLGRLLLQLLATAGQPRPGRVFAAYQPRPLTVSGRHAAYSANLFFLTVLVRGELRASEISGWTPREPAEAWHSQALLWQSQLPSEFFSVVETIAVRRIWAERGRDLVLTMAEPESLAATDPIDPLWTYDHRDAGTGFVWNQSSAWYMHRRVNFLAGTNTDVMWHSLGPLTSALGPHALSCFYKVFPDPTVSMSMARAAVEVCLLGALGEVPAAERTEAYRACAQICALDYDGPPAGHYEAMPVRLASLLLAALAGDHHAGPDAVLAVLEYLVNESAALARALSDEIRECVELVIRRDNQTALDRGGSPDPDGVASHRRLRELAGQVR